MNAAPCRRPGPAGPRQVTVVEVGPRDGLQNERAFVPTAAKVAFVDALAGAGLAHIEVSAFVSPAWVPQLADAEAVFAGIRRRPGVCYAALVPNLRGLERAMGAGADCVSVFAAASDTFSRHNINTTVAGSLRRLAPVLARARAARLRTRGYVSTAFWCPYEGPVPTARVVAVARALVGMGAMEISIGDTLGKATRAEVAAVVAALTAALPARQLALHLHDTYGRAVENVLAAWRLGIGRFDGSVGGLGGCPYAPGAAGNVATEAVVAALRAEGAEVAGHLGRLARARAALDPYLSGRGRG